MSQYKQNRELSTACRNDGAKAYVCKNVRIAHGAIFSELIKESLENVPLLFLLTD